MSLCRRPGRAWRKRRSLSRSPSFPMAQDPIGALLVEKLEEPEHARYYDKDLIERAFFLARKAHAGQKRRSGEDYLVHPVEVARILVDLGMDSDCIAAALLHDVVEDTGVTTQEVSKGFGSDVAQPCGGRDQAGQNPLHHQGRSSRRKTCARCFSPWPRTSASSSSSWPTACTTCARLTCHARETSAGTKSL